MVIQKSNAIKLVRKIAGSAYPREANIRTIREDFTHVSENRAKEKNLRKNLAMLQKTKKMQKRACSLVLNR